MEQKQDGCDEESESERSGQSTPSHASKAMDGENKGTDQDQRQNTDNQEKSLIEIDGHDIPVGLERESNSNRNDNENS